MKTAFIVSIFLLSAATFAQDATKMAEDMNKEMNTNITTANKKQYDIDMKKFQDQVMNAVREHQASTKSVKVGEFEVIIQDSCFIKMPTKPILPTPSEKECYMANVDAQTSAYLIAKATPLNPPSVDMVLNAVNHCELSVNWVKSFEIYNKCWTESMGASYDDIYEKQAQTLINKGYTLNPLTNRFEKSGGHRMTLDQSRNTMESVDPAQAPSLAS